LQGLEVTRRIYVPSADTYARFTEILWNPSGYPVDVTLSIHTNLGSDGSTGIIQTSNGDTSLDLGDTWVVTDDSSDGGGDPAVAHVFVWPSPSDAGISGGHLDYTYVLTVPAYGEATVAHFAVQRWQRSEAIEVALRLASQSMMGGVPFTDDFETGALFKLPWRTGGDEPWFVATSEAYSGQYSAQADDLYDSESTYLEVTSEVTSGSISFWYKVSSESCCDFLHFYIDGNEMDSWAGEIDWSLATFFVSPGSHTFRWEYTKDGSVSNGADTAWIDNVSLPGMWGLATSDDFEPLAGMVFIPAGSFEMGDSFNEGASNERPVHTVFVSAFYMDRYEVTKALWDEVATWADDHGYDIEPEDGSGNAPDHPVYYVTWYKAVKWVNARSEKEGLTPCYTVDGNVYRTGQSTPDCNWSANGYRLPTEAEWERAARGGAAGHRFPWSDTDTIQHARANYYSKRSYSYDTSPTHGDHPDYDDSGLAYTSPVGSFAPNGYGLYDMAGNVWEWCWGWDSNYYSGSPGADPRGPLSGSLRAGRGGCCYNYAYGCRVANRHNFWPDDSDYGYDLIGFRAVLPPVQ